MAIVDTQTSSLTSEVSLTRIHAESDLQTPHISRKTKSGFLVGEGRTAGHCPTPPPKRKSRGWVWTHGEAITRVSDGQKLWLCRHCFNNSHKGLPTTAAEPTTIPQRHMVKYHDYDIEGNYVGKQVIPAKRKTVRDQIQAQEEAQNSTFDRTAYKGLYTAWALRDNLSLRQATSSYLHELLTYRDPFVRNVLPQNHTTLSSWIKKYYSACKARISQQLLQARSRITISFDGWKSDSDMDLLGIMAHYIDSKYAHKTVLLALTPTAGSHTGENLAERLLQTAQEYKIGTSIGFFIADSASNNDTAIKCLSDDLEVTVKEQRLRCAAHIINLVCKAILLGVDDDCFEDICQDYDRDDDEATEATVRQFEATVRSEQDALKAWRKKGPVGKLHNLVVHVKASPAHRYYFESKQKEVDPLLPVYKLVTNGGIRWNSTHDMIQRALQLRDALDLYQSHYRYDKQHPTLYDELTNDDRLELSELKELLKPMADSSREIQANSAYGSQGALWQNLSVVDYLMSKLERKKQELEHLPPSHFKACVNLGWKKLNKYHQLTDHTYAYRAAIFLNPHLHSDWFEHHWGQTHPHWIKEMDKMMDQQYQRYQRLYPSERPSSGSSQEDMSDFARYNLISRSSNTSELQRYRKEAVLEGKGDIIHWWRDNQERYPILAHMALDTLAAPATTAADERVFSECDDVINNDRARLSEHSAEAIACTRSWITNGLVDLTTVSDIPYYKVIPSNELLHRYSYRHLRAITLPLRHSHPVSTSRGWWIHQKADRTNNTFTKLYTATSFLIG